MTPIFDLDSEHTKLAAQSSVLYDADVIKHLMANLDSEKCSNGLKLFVTRGIANMISTLKKDYLSFLIDNQLLEGFFNHLVKMSNPSMTVLDKKYTSYLIMPIINSELKAIRLRQIG